VIYLALADPHELAAVGLLRPIAILLGSVVLGPLAAVTILIILERLARQAGLGHPIIRRSRFPGALGTAGIALYGTAPISHAPSEAIAALSHLGIIAVIIAAAWEIIELTYAVEDVAVSRVSVHTQDNLRVARAKTQIHVLRRVVIVGVGLLALAAILLSFSRVRAVGASLLASAGIIGVVAAVGARPTLSNLVAGIQIAIAQPIRLDDVVVVEGHWGRVEEITLTYVVVKIWNQRRLVLPISYLVDQPFENWTKSGTELIAIVHLEVDYRTPVDELRSYLGEVLKQSPRWAGGPWSLQVTGAFTSTMQIRAVMKSPDSSQAWDLECEVRERLIAYIRDHFPDSLPRLRTETTKVTTT
jgi:small-conductance mechanosensitive channel